MELAFRIVVDSRDQGQNTPLYVKEAGACGFQDPNNPSVWSPYPDDPVFMLSVEGDQYELYFEKAEGKRGTFAGRVEKTATGKYLFYDDNGFPPSKSFFAKIGGRLSALKGKFTDDDIIKIVIKGTGSEYTVFYLKKV
jgi:hypothetical protein